MPSVPSTRHTPCHCMQLRKATNAVTKLYDDALRPFSITVNQFSLLNDIKALQPCTKSELAKCAGLDLSTITRNLRHLAAGGFIQNSAAQGARNSNISLTEQGRHVILQARPAWKAAQAKVEGLLAPKDIAQLHTLLASLTGSL